MFYIIKMFYIIPIIRFVSVNCTLFFIPVPLPQYIWAHLLFFSHSYLDAKKLCGRIPVQSFIDADQAQVDQICSRNGWRIKGAAGSKGNLCISQSTMMVYDVESGKLGGKCSIGDVYWRNDAVVVACDKVEGKCRPVHYEPYMNQEKDIHTCK